MLCTPCGLHAALSAAAAGPLRLPQVGACRPMRAPLPPAPPAMAVQHNVKLQLTYLDLDSENAGGAAVSNPARPAAAAGGSGKLLPSF